MSWTKVQRWRDRLAQFDPGFEPTGLSPEGARAALEVALGALDNASLAKVAAMGGSPFKTAAVVPARTVATAPIEWCAVLLGRGSKVLLKYSEADPGLALPMIEAARKVGLPLTGVTDRAAIQDVELIVAMGTDETVRAIRAAASAKTRVLPHGHQFSAAWIADSPLPSGRSSWEALAADAALHDGRGCLSPIVAFTPLPLDEAANALARAMDGAAKRWPTGTTSPVEHAMIRARRALARVTGEVRDGDGWAVHGLPLEQLDPISLPRCIALHHVRNLREAVEALRPWSKWLSTVGTDDPATVEAWARVGASRICWLGEMQRPPLIRSHDGEDWLRATARWVSREL